MSINHDLSKSSEHFSNQVHGISFNYKRNEIIKKKTHNEFFQDSEQSYDIEFNDNTQVRGKTKNESNFKPGTKQTVDQHEYKKLKKKFDFEEIQEKSDEEQQNDERENSKENDKKSKKNRRGASKKNKNTKKNYTVKNKNPKVIEDDEDEEEEINNNKSEKEEQEKEQEKEKSDEELKLDLDDSNDSEKEQKKKKNKKNNNKKNKKRKKLSKKEKKNDKKKDTSEEEENNSENSENSENDNNYKNNKQSKGTKSELGKANFRKNKKTKSTKWNESEYQSLLTESKDYIPFKDYDINKFILTLSQINNIKNNPELYNKYNNFISLKKKQDKIQFETLIKNILLNFKYICKDYRFLSPSFTVNTLFKGQDMLEFDFKSNEKTAYFDLFISFISMYTSDYESFVESTSIKDTNKLIIPLHALAYIFSSQLFFCDIAKLIQNYYDKFLSYKIIPIHTKLNEEFIHRINSRHIIWKQFEAPFLFFKNKKKLYLKEENGESKIDEKKVEDFADKISLNINNAYNTFVNDIVKRHNDINKFNINDKKINLINNDTSVPSSLYNQINGDVTFKLKMNLYKYKMKQMKIRKLCKLNDAKIKKNEFEKKVKNTIFKKAAFYMSSCDVVQDFLDNYN
jgi:hypothetical protein